MGGVVDLKSQLRRGLGCGCNGGKQRPKDGATLISDYAASGITSICSRSVAGTAPSSAIHERKLFRNSSRSRSMHQARTSSTATQVEGS